MPQEAYELTVSGILAGQFVQNVMHVNVDNTTSENPYVVATKVLEGLNGIAGFFFKWGAALPTDYRVTSARCRRVLLTGGPTAILLGAAISNNVGLRAGSIQAAQVNPLLVWLTTIRPNRPGKTFLPGLSETDCDDMVYTAPFVTVLNDLITQVVTNFVLPTLAFNANFGILRRAAAGSDDITAGRISPLIGTQRRRLRPV